VQQLYAYIATEFGNKAADNFLERLYIRIYSLSVTPFSGVVVPKQKDVRRIIVSKQNKLYYRVKGKTVTVLILFSSKQNPKKNRYE
jgi:plasmid stabilization system protein ParE